ncbi:MAG: hypothetical protein A2469_04285 [Candidatus Magasanikbacteria bacterium RIFOXYC2_FULL_40_16]|uniref:Glycosyltransferase 2-like domain-containing protein n=3 Tax=Candidatus Magasanikiibacteriota TaxID=1752731 RepID=A0A1F6NEL3_9BACT|nr:MAG: hypothetical protein A2224_01935 [Candidatus Magasanikbacteria bacterium RIFOXYA2_FULL_40_20]OGH82269.1 MAG: hypothetical protein A2373_03640 [Candidatus Magasanikbacteria bacterium RIFOXYB1_FULL_40_15]OGH86243.1 MAG: hypothetical protein A2301_02395 [Candidatus Magasanikbacteria bacterium RIFOXYB2_FULL_40_13]OGH87310.1 MAG: hypothetical protein A2206_03185 [Candidatus Magasanikbacteria bacterium RIFOXYA1_FULL_40_8]OGH89216.1 MAG: hypothetical protein A2469_04285 [Candidatus Magasanikba
MKDINVVFVNYLMGDDILKAVESLSADILGCPYSVQITIVDNSNNKDGVRDKLLEKFINIKYINTGVNVGFGRGNNIGFQATQARYYFALNRDTIIFPNSNTIERIIKFMDEHPKIGCIGTKLVNIDQTLQDTCYRFDLKSIAIKPFKQINFDRKYNWVKKYANRLLMKDFNHSETRPVDWVLGAAMVVRKEVVDAIGWFDDRYFMYLEDCDWCRTMWEHGWPVYYVHDIVIQHRYARGSAEIPGIFKALIKNKLARIHLASWVKYIFKWRGKFKYYKSA